MHGKGMHVCDTWHAMCHHAWPFESLYKGGLKISLCGGGSKKQSVEASKEKEEEGKRGREERRREREERKGEREEKGGKGKKKREEERGGREEKEEEKGMNVVQ